MYQLRLSSESRSSGFAPCYDCSGDYGVSFNVVGACEAKHLIA